MKSARRFLLLLLLVPSALLGLTGCPFDRWFEESDYRKADKTPNGWHVNYGDQGTVGGGHATLVEVYADFDAAMDRTYVALGQAAWDVVRDRKVVFELVDHTRFPIQGVYATGAYDGGDGIIVAMYATQSAPPGSPFPAQALPWTCRIGTVTGTTYWGQREGNVPFPALEHEIGHALGLVYP